MPLWRAVCSVSLCVVAGCRSGAAPPNTIPVRLPGGAVLHAEVAATPETQTRGLMFRDRLPERRAMLFVYPDDLPREFWMKHVAFDLDMAFLDGDGRVRHLFARVPAAHALTPDEAIPRVQGRARYVLEMHAGSIERHRLRVGDRIAFTLPSGSAIPD
ncbi:MAG TPA: DUF192 domain-containing protein [bacterium]